MTSAANLRDRIDKAAERAEAEKTRLLKRDGSQIYSDSEHAERTNAIIGEMARVADEVNEAAGELTEEKESELYKYRHGDPTGDLLDQQLEVASVKRIFVKEDCEELSLDELAKRLRGVLAEGKKEMVWLYARYARRRANRVLEELRNSRSAPSEAGRETSARLREVEELLPTLEEKAGSTFDKQEAEKVEAELQELQGVRSYATWKRMEVDGTDARYRREYAQATWRSI